MSLTDLAPQALIRESDTPVALPTFNPGAVRWQSPMRTASRFAWRWVVTPFLAGAVGLSFMAAVSALLFVTGGR